MKKALIILGLLFAPLAARAQVSNPSIIPVPSAPSSCGTLPLKVVQNTNQVYGTNGSGGCAQIGGGGGGGSSVTLENVYAAPGQFTFTHNLGTLFYQIHCIARVGAGYAPATCSDFPVDTNNSTVTVPAAGDYIVSFSAVTTLTPNFNIAVVPATQLYEPTMTGTQQPTFAISQAAVAGYSGTVTYSTSGLAGGMTGAYSPTTITGSGSSTLTLSFPATQTPATTNFTLQGTDGTITHTLAPTITVGNINTNLVECWPMTDGSGSSFASSCGTSNTETLGTGSCTWASNAGLPGTTCTLSSTAYAAGANTTATNFNGSVSFSIGTWVKFNDLSTYHDIVSNLNGSIVGYELNTNNTNNQLVWSMYDGTNTLQVATPASSIATGTLYYIVVTYDGSKAAAGMKVYINGVPQTTSTGGPSISGSTSNSTPVNLGARPGGTLPLNGLMAYTRIYNRALSATDVANYYAAGAR